MAFDMTTWTLVDSTTSERTWRSRDGDVLVASRIEELPEFETWRNEDAMRRDAGLLAESNQGELVSADHDLVNGRFVARIIYRRTGEGLGSSYTGLRFSEQAGGYSLLTMVAQEQAGADPERVALPCLDAPEMPEALHRVRDTLDAFPPVVFD